jgi:hypothetical protein
MRLAVCARRHLVHLAPPAVFLHTVSLISVLAAPLPVGFVPQCYCWHALSRISGRYLADLHSLGSMRGPVRTHLHLVAHATTSYLDRLSSSNLD